MRCVRRAKNLTKERKKFEEEKILHLSKELRDMIEKLSKFEWNIKIGILRRFHRIKKKEMAEKCQTHDSTYSAWESGKRYPRYFNRILIAKALNVNVTDIF